MYGFCAHVSTDFGLRFSLFFMELSTAGTYYYPAIFEFADMRKKGSFGANNKNVFRRPWEAWEEERDWDENDEIKELEGENDEFRGEIWRLRKENSKLKGQSSKFVSFLFTLKEGMAILGGFANEMV